MDIELDFKRIPSLADELSQLEIGSSCVSLVSEHRHRQFFKPHLHYRGKMNPLFIQLEQYHKQMKQQGNIVLVNLTYGRARMVIPEEIQRRIRQKAQKVIHLLK